MGGPNLSAEEHMLLVELSYYDVHGGPGGRSVEQLLYDMSSDPGAQYGSEQRAWAQSKLDELAHDPGRYANMSSLKLTAYVNDNPPAGNKSTGSGLVGYGFSDGKNSVELFRGSENGIGSVLTDEGRDWQQDFTGANDQLRDAEAFDKQFRKTTRGQGLLYMGHSLGGGVALHLLIGNPSASGWTLNAPVFDRDPSDSELLKRLVQTGHLDPICGEHDPVSLLPFGAGSMWLTEYGGLVYKDKYGLLNIDLMKAHMPWKGEDYDSYMGQFRHHNGAGSGPGLVGLRMEIDTVRAADAAGKIRAALALAEDLERSVDRIGRALVEDALDLQRDGDVKQTLGRHMAIAATTPTLSSILATVAEDIRVGVSFAVIDAHIHFDRRRNRDGMERLHEYSRSIAERFDPCEQRVAGEVARLS